MSGRSAELGNRSRSRGTSVFDNISLAKGAWTYPRNDTHCPSQAVQYEHVTQAWTTGAFVLPGTEMGLGMDIHPMQRQKDTGISLGFLRNATGFESRRM